MELPDKDDEPDELGKIVEHSSRHPDAGSVELIDNPARHHSDASSVDIAPATGDVPGEVNFGAAGDETKETKSAEQSRAPSGPKRWTTFLSMEEMRKNYGKTYRPPTAVSEIDTVDEVDLGNMSDTGSVETRV